MAQKLIYEIESITDLSGFKAAFEEQKRLLAISEKAAAANTSGKESLFDAQIKVRTERLQKMTEVLDKFVAAQQSALSPELQSIKQMVDSTRSSLFAPTAPSVVVAPTMPIAPTNADLQLTAEFEKRRQELAARRAKALAPEEVWQGPLQPASVPPPTLDEQYQASQERITQLSNAYESLKKPEIVSKMNEGGDILEEKVMSEIKAMRDRNVVVLDARKANNELGASYDELKAQTDSMTAALDSEHGKSVLARSDARALAEAKKSEAEATKAASDAKIQRGTAVSDEASLDVVTRMRDAEIENITRLKAKGLATTEAEERLRGYNEALNTETALTIKAAKEAKEFAIIEANIAVASTDAALGAARHSRATQEQIKSLQDAAIAARKYRDEMSGATSIPVVNESLTRVREEAAKAKKVIEEIGPPTTHTAGRFMMLHAALSPLAYSIPGLSHAMTLLHHGMSSISSGAAGATKMVGGLAAAFVGFEFAQHFRKEMAELEKQMQALSDAGSKQVNWVDSVRTLFAEAGIEASQYARSLDQVGVAQDEIADRTAKIEHALDREHSAANKAVQMQKELELSRIRAMEAAGDITKEKATRMRLELDTKFFEQQLDVALKEAQRKLSSLQKEQHGEALRASQLAPELATAQEAVVQAKVRRRQLEAAISTDKESVSGKEAEMSKQSEEIEELRKSQERYKAILDSETSDDESKGMAATALLNPKYERVAAYDSEVEQNRKKKELIKENQNRLEDAQEEEALAKDKLKQVEGQLTEATKRSRELANQIEVKEADLAQQRRDTANAKNVSRQTKYNEEIGVAAAKVKELSDKQFNIQRSGINDAASRMDLLAVANELRVAKAELDRLKKNPPKTEAVPAALTVASGLQDKQLDLEGKLAKAEVELRGLKDYLKSLTTIKNNNGINVPNTGADQKLVGMIGQQIAGKEAIVKDLKRQLGLVDGQPIVGLDQTSKVGSGNATVPIQTELQKQQDKLSKLEALQADKSLSEIERGQVREELEKVKAETERLRIKESMPKAKRPDASIDELMDRPLIPSSQSTTGVPVVPTMAPNLAALGDALEGERRRSTGLLEQLVRQSNAQSVRIEQIAKQVQRV